MTDPLLRGLEHDLNCLRYHRDTVLGILRDEQLAPTAKLQAIERLLKSERDQEEEAEETRDRERLS